MIIRPVQERLYDDATKREETLRETCKEPAVKEIKPRQRPREVPIYENYDNLRIEKERKLISKTTRA